MSCGEDPGDLLDCNEKEALTWPPGEHPALESFFEQIRTRLRNIQNLLCVCCRGALDHFKPIGYWPLDEDINPAPGQNEVYDFVNDNSGAITKNVGQSWNQITKESDPAVSGLALDNGQGFSMVRIQDSKDIPELQLHNGSGQPGFTVLGWFYSTSVLVSTASIGCRDDTNEEGWSWGINADGTSTGISYWSTDGTLEGAGSLDTQIDKVGQNEWVFGGFSISEWDDEVDDGQRITLWINGQACKVIDHVGPPIEAATTSADIGFGGNRGDNPNAVRIRGLMDELQIYEGVLTETQVHTLYRDPGFMKQQLILTQTLDQIPNGADFSKVGSDWVDSTGRPLPSLDKLAIGVTQNETCAEGGGLTVGTQPEFGGIDHEDESDYFGFVHWYEDGVHVHTQKTTNLWQGVLAGHAPSTYNYSDGTTGSDAAGATQHTISVEFVLMKENASRSGNNDAAVGYRKASIQATYGTC